MSGANECKIDGLKKGPSKVMQYLNDFPHQHPRGQSAVLVYTRLLQDISYLKVHGFKGLPMRKLTSGVYTRPAEPVSLVPQSCIVVLPNGDFLYCATLFKTSPKALEYNNVTLTVLLKKDSERVHSRNDGISS
ncbi:hypothetical protein TNCV_4431651 [Trichonephila clavipes]|nr:hypothetical protein TNCV_4431651 [Trichonephila clavipes]